LNVRSTMVFLSSEPLTNPFAASVAYWTVLHVIVDSLRDTRSDTGDAAYATAQNAQTAETAVPAKRARIRERARIAIYVALG
jgi:hypothetical protein